MAELDNNLKVARGVDQRLYALHGHWITADAVRYHLTRSSKRLLDRSNKMTPKLMMRSGFELSKFHVICAWYSLLYVVVEGYNDLGGHDKTIDDLLSNAAMVDLLRRFRNATFHFQDEPISPKMMEFLKAEGSETWIRDLNRAFDKWLTSELRIEQDMLRVTAELKKSSSGKRAIKKNLWRIRFWGKHGRL